MFHELAQEVLEYLGVPHDQPLKTAPELEKDAAKAAAVHEDESEPGDDLTALFADVNELPADDPLRKPPAPAETAAESVDAEAAGAGTPAGTVVAGGAAGPGHGKGKQAAAVEAVAGEPAADEPVVVPAALPGAGTVVVGAGRDVVVPDFAGSTVRAATEKAGAAGLGVQVIGSGLARAQAPAPGVKVSAGT